MALDFKCSPHLSESSGLLMTSCMRYLSLVSVFPAVDDRQLSTCVEKQCIVLLNGTVSKAYFSQ